MTKSDLKEKKNQGEPNAQKLKQERGKKKLTIYENHTNSNYKSIAKL